MNSPRPTLYDVARLAGVSTATVSYTFSKPDRVKPDTKNHVLQIAKEIGYIPRASARDLARGKTGALGLYSFDMYLDVYSQISLDKKVCNEKNEFCIDPRISNTQAKDYSLSYQSPLYVDEIQRGFEIECWKQGLALVLSNSKNSEVDLRDFASRVDGFAVFPGMTDITTLSVIAKCLPVVLISRFDKDLPCDRILADNEGGMKLLLDHLQKVHGVSSFCFIGDLSFPEFKERYDALKKYAQRIPHSSVELIDSYDPNKQVNTTALDTCIKQENLPQSFICGSDQIAIQIIQYLSDNGISVPKDVIVTGFDGIIAGRLTSPSLTTVRQPMEAMGILAVRLLVERSKSLEREPSVYRMATELVIGESCGCKLHN